MRFIDLFAGLGGFHVGLESLGHNCVFASEINEELRLLYERNYEIAAKGDIKEINVVDIPAHDVLAAGFPCQPFSKAGGQEGLNDEDRGTLFYDIARILEHHLPTFFVLENVPNLKSHDEGNTWRKILLTLHDLGYIVDSKKLSPHQFGIPQMRERIFIVGSRVGLDHFNWPERITLTEAMDVRGILDENPQIEKPLGQREIDCIDLWNRILTALPADAKLPSFPIWSMEWEANYPFEYEAPFHYTRVQLDDHRGAFGSLLHGMTKGNQIERIPSYARVKPKKGKEFPNWKKNFIRQNRAFYNEYRNVLQPFIPELQILPPSWQKFEWNCQGAERNLGQLLLQFRSSGLRVKRSDYTPALVSSSSTQIPILGWENRYITKSEATKLQSLGAIKLPESENSSFKALGNAVNAVVIKLIAENLLKNNIQVNSEFAFEEETF